MSRFDAVLSRLPGQQDRTNGGDTPGTKGLKPLCPGAGGQGQMSRSSVPVQDKPPPQATGALREVMPLTASIVDEARLLWGDALVNRCIARGQSLRRDHARIVATQGQAEADRWLAREQAKGVWFGAIEGGRQVGVMPVEAA